jgi:hypothetical protein
VFNAGALTVTNSTISGNDVLTSNGGSGGGISGSGTLTVTTSIISGDTSFYTDGGGMFNSGTLTVTHTLVAGNTAPTGPEIFNSVTYGGTVLADNSNLFGGDGNAGEVGFSPGAADVVPPKGVLLSEILNPTLAPNGGPTQTHALVPGSPAIDAAGPACLDASGAPLVTDQRGRPRPVDGNGDGMTACDIGAVEFYPLVNALVTLAPNLDTAFDPTPVPEGPARTFTITATFTNTSPTPLRFPFFVVTTLSGGHLLLNAAEGVQGVGATVPLAVEEDVLEPGAVVAVAFIIGLQEQEPFRFEVDLFGEPLH